MSGLMQSRWASPPTAQSQQETDQENEVDAQRDSDKRPLHPSALSGAAQTFAPSPAPPPPDTSTYDEFAQTGADDDDLFDDIIPESMQTRPQDDLFAEDITPATQSDIIDPPAKAPQRQAGSSSRGRERGPGRGRDTHAGRNNARPKPNATKNIVEKEATSQVSTLR